LGGDAAGVGVGSSAILLCQDPAIAALDADFNRVFHDLSLSKF